jgi:hypothetical protein
MFTLICEDERILVEKEIIVKIPVLFDMATDLEETELEVPWLSAAGLRAIIATFTESIIPSFDMLEAFECARIDMTKCYPLCLAYEKELLENGSDDPYFGLLQYDDTMDAFFPHRNKEFSKLRPIIEEMPAVIVGDIVFQIISSCTAEKTVVSDFFYFGITPEEAEEKTHELYNKYQLIGGMVNLTYQKYSI